MEMHKTAMAAQVLVLKNSVATASLNTAKNAIPVNLPHHLQRYRPYGIMPFPLNGAMNFAKESSAAMVK
jgi:hypothetical protein